MVISLFFNHPHPPPQHQHHHPQEQSHTHLHILPSCLALTVTKTLRLTEKLPLRSKRDPFYIVRLPLYLRLHNMLIYCCVLLMYSITKCDTTSSYFSKQDFCTALQLHFTYMILKNKNLFFIF